MLADVGMPERNGYDVAAFVKSTPEFAHIPVLLLTGAFEPVDEQRARAAGCDGVLAKPFEPHMVIARVKELLAASSGGGTAGIVDGPTPVSVDVIGVDLVPPPAMADDADAGAAEAAGESPAALAGAAPEPVAPPEAQAPLRLSRRTPIAMPGFGAPVPATGSTAALDEYFDRLDAAFATLQQPAAEPAGEATVPAAWAEDKAAGRAADAPADHPAGAPAPDAPQEAGPAPRQGAPVSGIAQAFASVFAAERGEAAAPPVLVGGLPQAAIDDLVERVTRQVLERLSDRVVRDTVADVVSRVAERLVRDEIERVKATRK